MIRFNNGANFTCPNCRQPFVAQIDQIVDVGRDPAAKARLLSGQTNLITCPHCRYRFAIGVPLLYHDAGKALLLVYVPMELGLPQAEQERLIGDLVNRLMSDIPNEQRRGYLLQPRTALTMQGMVEQILQADGITPQMIDAQREKARLVDTLLQSDEADLDRLIAEHDSRIDMDFFNILAGVAENAVQSGRQDVARHVIAVQQYLMEHTTAGQQVMQDIEAQEQAIQEVTEALEELGERPTLQDFVALVIGFAGRDDHLQALVGLQRPVFDYTFFQELSGRIEKLDGDGRARLEALRDRLLELVDLVDQQQQIVLQAAVAVLREIMNSQDIEAAVRRNLSRIDDNFLAVLTVNSRAAEQNKDMVASARLKQVMEVVMRVLQESAPPELRFIGDLLREESPEAARAMVAEKAAEIGPSLLALMDRLAGDLLARGDQPTAQRLIALRDHAAETIGESVP